MEPHEAENGLEHAVNKLIENNRPLEALRCLYRMLRRGQPLDSKQVVAALLAAQASSEDVGTDYDYYDVSVELIKAVPS